MVAGPGISVKLSALHPRYARQQRERVMTELLPRLQALAQLARGYGIGLNIDAEESDRLELSLDLLETLALDPAFAGWDGIGFVVQAYGKRAPFVLDWIIDLARRSGHGGSWCGWSRAPTGTARSSARRSTGSRTFPSTRARCTRTCPTSPAPGKHAGARRTRSSRNSPPTTR